MKITCTLSEYTKMARQCGETKARFNCRACPLNGLLELEEGEKCDIERFVQNITMYDAKAWENVKRKAMEEHTMLNNQHAPETPLVFNVKGIPSPKEMERFVHAHSSVARGEQLETR